MNELDTDQGFWDIYDDAFIREEREPRNVIRGLVNSADALVYSFRKDGVTVGICTVELLKSLSCGFIVYLAVSRSIRGSGVGSGMLKCVLSPESYCAAEIGIPERFILEVEHPDYASDERQRIIREKRIHFFSRASLNPLFQGYLQPPLSPGFPVLPMVLLSSGGWKITPEAAVHAVYREKYHRVNGISSAVLEDLYFRSLGIRTSF